MGKRRQQYRPKDFESTQVSNDTSANLYISMLLSDAWQDLNDSARVIYLYMKSQFYGQKKVADNDYMGEKIEYGQEHFYFNRGLFKKFGKTDPTTCKKAIDKLVSHGFIELVHDGKRTRTNSIYKFSSKWQTWELSQEELQKKKDKKAMLKKNLESKIK